MLFLVYEGGKVDVLSGENEESYEGKLMESVKEVGVN
jgi:hypothetical protein